MVCPLCRAPLVTDRSLPRLAQFSTVDPTIRRWQILQLHEKSKVYRSCREEDESGYTDRVTGFDRYYWDSLGNKASISLYVHEICIFDHPSTDRAAITIDDIIVEHPAEFQWDELIRSICEGTRSWNEINVTLRAQSKNPAMMERLRGHRGIFLYDESNDDME